MGNGEEHSRHSRRGMERTGQRNLGNQRGKPAFRLLESNVLGRFGSGNENRQYAKKYKYIERWQKEADKIKTDVMTHGWKEKIHSFSQTYENTALDSSLLLMEPYGFIEANDIRYHQTVKAIKKRCYTKA